MATGSTARPDTVKITILPDRVSDTFPSGTRISEAAAKLERSTLGSCGGRVKCTGCAVEFVDAANGVPVQRMKAAERELLAGQGFPVDGSVRLSCLIKPFGDVAVTHVGKETGDFVIEKSAAVLDIEADPAVTLHTVNVEGLKTHDASGFLERLKEATQNQDIIWDSVLERALPEDKSEVTVALYHNDDGQSTVINLYPDKKETVYGIACDIGTTTIAIHLCDLNSGEIIASSSMMNPQMDFGADVLSRISQIQQDGDNLLRMTKLVRGAVNDLAEKVCDQADIDINDILDSVIVGNPTMRHLFMGLDPEHLGSAPSKQDIEAGRGNTALPATTDNTGKFDLKLGQGARCHILPDLGGHVGADATAALLATGIHEKDEIILLVDVGTNAEIFLGNRNGIISASAPAAPAFEGAEISCGQRAAKGAIEAVKIYPGSPQIHYKVISEDRWSYDDEFPQDLHVTGICGSGIIDLIAQMHQSGLLNANGQILPDPDAIKARTIQQDENGKTFSCVVREGTPPIKLTQTDVSNFLFVKGAIRSAIEVLKKETGTPSIDKIYIAGGFGTHINLDNAVALGLVPKDAQTEVKAIGNAAGDGAYMALVNRHQRSAITDITNQARHIEVANYPEFQEFFADASCIPYGAAPAKRRGGRKSRVRKAPEVN